MCVFVSMFVRGVDPVSALGLPGVSALGRRFLFRGGDVVGVHGTNGRFIWAFKPLNSAQQGCEVT
jgi:hypothetical protein